MIDGRTVMEVDDSSRSNLEIEQLWQYLRGRLKNLARGATLPQAQAVAAGGGAYQAAGLESHGAK
jgi:hypothetical protein